MSLVMLNPNTLKALKALLDNPTGALPAVLKGLHPSGPWDLFTQKVGSNLAKTNEVEVALPLLDESVADDGVVSGGWKWSASVELNSALAIDLLTDEDLEGLHIRPDAGHTLVVYGGQISAGGQLGINTSGVAWGAAGLSAGGKRAASLRWYVQAKDDTTLLEATAAAQRHFIWPHDLQGMLRLANRTDWFGMACELDGEAQLEINVNATAQGTGWTFSHNGDTASVGLSFGVKAGFKAARSSRWRLSAMVEPRAQADGATVLGLRLKLDDLKQSSRSASLEITAGADFSAVAASAEQALRAAWPELDSPLLDALAQPGTAIADRLRALIDAKLDGSLQQLATVLIGGPPTPAMRDGLVDRLTGGLTDALDGALASLAAGQADLDQAVAAWLQQLLGKAADAVTVDDKLKAVVADAVTQATAGLKGAIDELKAQIVGKAQGEVDALLKRLGELGAQFDKQLDNLNANKASQVIQRALTRYADAREKLLGVLTDSHRQKLMLTLAASFTQDTATEAVFEAWFRPDSIPTPEAERLFHALCGGRLLGLPELVAAAAGTGAVADAKGWLLATRKTLEQQRVTLNFFGIQIASSSSWLREVSVKTDLVTGNLLAVNAQVQGGTAIVNPWKNRSARLGLQLELVGGQSGPATLAAALSGAFTASQEKTDRKTVQRLLNDYADATGAQRNDIGLLLDLPTPTTPPQEARRFWKQLTIALPVALSTEQWALFASQDTRTTERVALAVALAQFRRRYAPDSLFNDDPVRDLRDLVATHFDVKTVNDADMLRFLKLFPEGFVSRFSAPSEAGRVSIEAPGVTSPGARRFMAYHRLSATVFAPLRLQALAAEAASRVQSLPPAPDPVAVRKLLDPILTQMQQILQPVALVSETWTGIGVLGADDEAVTWPFVSFITTMAKLAGIPVPPGFVPIAQSGDKPAVRLE